MAKLIEQAGFRRAINDRACCGMIRSGARPAWVPGRAAREEDTPPPGAMWEGGGKTAGP